MFVKRLTEEQIKDFLDEQCDRDYFKYEFTHNKKREIIVATVKYLHNSEEFDSFWLSNFEAIGSCSSSLENIWLRYLYKIFGEEYKESYLENCAKVFE